MNESTKDIHKDQIRSFATHEYTRDIHKDYDKKSCNDQNKVALKISLINNYFVNLCLSAMNVIC